MIDSDNSIESLAVSVNAPVAGAANVSMNLPIVVGANGRPVVSIDPTKRFDLTLNEDGYGPSDHSSFYAKQIPVLFFWTGTHDDYHKPSDTADKINYEGEARIVSFVERLVRELDKSDKRPTYTVAKSESQGRSTGFRVYLGTIPDYTTEVKGVMNQAAGAVQDAYGKTVDTAMEGAQSVKEAAIEGHDIVRKFVEDNPHTATAIALGIGFFIGYATHTQPPRRHWWD